MKDQTVLILISAGVGVVITLLGIISKTLFGMRDNVRDLLKENGAQKETIERHGVIIGQHGIDLIRIKERLKFRTEDDHSVSTLIP